MKDTVPSFISQSHIIRPTAVPQKVGALENHAIPSTELAAKWKILLNSAKSGVHESQPRRLTHSLILHVCVFFVGPSFFQLGMSTVDP